MADVIVVHGYPGSGKTTQCARAAKEGFDGRDVHHVSVTDIDTLPLRPNEIACCAVSEALKRSSADGLFLIENSPRYAHAVQAFDAALQDDSHTLLGTINFDITLTTSIKRALSRSAEEGTTTAAEYLESLACFQFNRHKNTIQIAILALSNLAPVETIDASSDKEAVYSQFASAIGRLILQNPSRR